MHEKIEQVDATLCEDGKTVMLMGHTADERVTFTASIDLPLPISAGAFLPREWVGLAASVDWLRHGPSA